MSTTKGIRDRATRENIKIPSAITRKDMVIEYYNGKVWERENITRRAAMTSDVEVIPVYPDEDIPWRDHLMKHGWAVAPIPDLSVTSCVDRYWDFLEMCSPDGNGRSMVRRYDPNTWVGKNVPPALHGIFKQYFGHTALQWEVREACAPIFSRIWDVPERDLLCSFDGGCFLGSRGSHKYRQWFHSDMPRWYTRDMTSVQGVVNLTSSGEDDGGLVLLGGDPDIGDDFDHRNVIVDYYNRHPSGGIVWEPIDMGDPILSSMIGWKICAAPGTITLFDGRFIHTGKTPSRNHRMSLYVSMGPREYATSRELSKRIKLHGGARMTGHWCYGQWFKETAEHPRTYGKEVVKPAHIEIARLSPLGRRLVGYDV